MGVFYQSFISHLTAINGQPRSSVAQSHPLSSILSYPSLKLGKESTP